MMKPWKGFLIFLSPVIALVLAFGIGTLMYMNECMGWELPIYRMLVVVIVFALCVYITRDRP